MDLPPNHPSHWTIFVLKPMVLWIPLHILLHIYLVGGLEHEFYCSIQLGISSSQLTFTPSFFRGVEIQPDVYPLVNIQKAIENGPFIVDLRIKNCDFP